MDLKKLETRPAHDAGAEMRVIGPDGKLTDFYITLAGKDSRLWSKERVKIERRLLDSIESDIPGSVATMTLSWRGLKSNKKNVPYEFEVAKKLYTDAPYICEQADQFIAERANFLMASRKK